MLMTVAVVVFMVGLVSEQVAQCALTGVNRSGDRRAKRRVPERPGIHRMIHIFIGTKAQFIKMAPLMMEMGRRGMPYHLIETGQHAALTADLIEEFGLREAGHAPSDRLYQYCNSRPGCPLECENAPWPPVAAGGH